MSSPARPQKIDELESIRGLAALLVVFFHLPKWHPLLDNGLINNSYLMVELFFVLSGFVIFNAYGENIQTKQALLRFQFLRFGRLYPVHLIFLFVTLAIESAKYIAATHFNIESTTSAPFEINSLSAFIKHLLLISAVLPNQALSFNNPAWSISVEFYTYFVFALIILFFGKIKTSVFLLIATCALTLLVSKNTFGFNDLLRCFSGFFIGCLTASVTKRVTCTLPAYLTWLVMIAIVLFLQEKPSTVYDPIIFFLTAALIASLVLSKDNALKVLLRTKCLAWLGTVSYSVYMSHYSIEWVVNQFIRVALKKPVAVYANGKSEAQLSSVETLFACLIVVVSVLLVSALVYHFVEKPMREKSRRFALHRFS